MYKENWETTSVWWELHKNTDHNGKYFFGQCQNETRFFAFEQMTWKKSYGMNAWHYTTYYYNAYSLFISSYLKWKGTTDKL